MKKKKSSQNKMKSIGVLCSGGDAPGMNAAIRAVVRYGITSGLQVHGIHRGYAGLLEGQIEPMNLRSVANIIQRGGTILKTARCQAFFQKQSRAEATHILRRKGIDGLVVIGGDGSYTGAKLMGEENDYPIVGLPGTIDNDVFGTDYTIGFDTAVNTAVEAIDKIRDTASSHDRFFLVEVMGRTSLEIATRVALCGGAENVYIPSSKKSFANLAKILKASKEKGKLSSIVIVAEGQHPGHTDLISKELKKNAGLESRVVILGHVQRGGSPTAQDRWMASLMGAKAVDALIKGDHATAISFAEGKLKTVPFSKIVDFKKTPDQAMLELVQSLAN